MNAIAGTITVRTSSVSMSTPMHTMTPICGAGDQEDAVVHTQRHEEHEAEQQHGGQQRLQQDEHDQDADEDQRAQQRFETARPSFPHGLREIASGDPKRGI